MPDGIYLRIFDRSRDAKLVLDRHGRIVRSNAAFLELHGDHAGQYVGSVLGGVLGPGTAPERWERLLAHCRACERCEVAVAFPSLDGVPVFRRLTVSTLRDEGSLLAGYLVTLPAGAEAPDCAAPAPQDGSSMPLQEQAAAGSRQSEGTLVETFGGCVAHELRAPLRCIGGYASLLLLDHAARMPADAVASLDRIVAAVGRMDGIVDGLIELAVRPACGVEPQRLDLSAIAREVVEELKAADPGHVPVVRIAAGLTAVGDPVLLRIVLRNLLANAWKFSSGRDGARIEFDRERVEEGGAFYVRDNGVGFGTADAARLFQPFGRVHRERAFEGTGIGLALVRRIVERHAGRIWAQGVVDAGATFRFTLGEASAQSRRPGTEAGDDAHRG